MPELRFSDFTGIRITLIYELLLGMDVAFEPDLACAQNTRSG